MSRGALRLGAAVTLVLLLITTLDVAAQGPALFPSENLMDLAGPARRFGDMNQDGLADLVAWMWAGYPDSIVRVALANEQGSFDPYLDVLASVEYLDLDVADLDADGWPDLVAAKLNGFLRRINLGGGVLGPELPVGVGSTPLSKMALADLDGDGWQDIIAGNLGQGVILIKGTGPGAFGVPVLVPLDTHISVLEIADLDLDGDLDVAVSQPAPNLVAVMLAQPDGYLGTAGYTVQAGTADSMTLADLDESGLPELLTVESDPPVGSTVGSLYRAEADGIGASCQRI